MITQPGIDQVLTATAEAVSVQQAQRAAVLATAAAAAPPEGDTSPAAPAAGTADSGVPDRGPGG